MNIPNFRREDCLWEHLRVTDKPIVLYGTGNGADKIIDQCARCGVEISGVFASDGFVRSRIFRGMQVESYDAIRERLGDGIIILMAFGSPLPEIAERCRALAVAHEFYIPEVPLYPSDVFDFDYYEAHYSEITEALGLFEEEYSRRLYCDMIAFRMTGRPEYLALCESLADSLASLTDTSSVRNIIDSGAFIGDTARIFADTYENLDTVYAIEPDGRTFRKLSAYAEEESRCKIIPVKSAAYDRVGEIEFESSGSRGSGVQGANSRAKTTVTECVTVDSVGLGKGIDLIKYDVEGDEAKALDGSLGVIAESRPTVILSLYHRTDDLFALPQRMRELLPDAKFYLRRVPCIPAWDITLIAVSERHRK